MRDIPPFLHTSSWRGDELRVGATLPCETWIPTSVRLLWYLTRCNMVERNRRFRETYCFGFRVFYPKDNKPHTGKRFFFSAKRSGGLWHPPKLLFHRYQGFIPWEKAAEAWSYHSPPSSTDVKNEWSSPPLLIRLQQVLPTRWRISNKLPYSVTFHNSYIQFNSTYPMSAVRIVTRLRTAQSGVRISTAASDFSLFQIVQIDSSAQSVCCSMGIGQTLKPTTPSNTEVKNVWSCTSTLL